MTTAPDDSAGSVPAADPADAVGESLRRAARVVLAVSGGRDSMALLHAAARAAPECVASVATYDHGTGAAATAGTELVAAEAARYGLPCRVGRAAGRIAPSESAWRAQRWRFLRATAAEVGVRTIVTAHTRDDHIETVVIRILRHAGARGLAALDTDGDVARPWLHTRRADIVRYAEAWGLPHVRDPSNDSRAFLRNRVRLDLLPALRAVHPRIDAELLGLAAEAASWRRRLEGLVAAEHPLRVESDGVSVAAYALARYDPDSLAVLWQVFAASAGVTLDRRGTAQLAAFTRSGRPGAVTQVSGGFEVQRSRYSLVLRRPGYRPAGVSPEAEGARRSAFPVVWIQASEPD